MLASREDNGFDRPAAWLGNVSGWAWLGRFQALHDFLGGLLCALLLGLYSGFFEDYAAVRFIRLDRSYNRMLWTALRRKAAYLPG